MQYKPNNASQPYPKPKPGETVTPFSYPPLSKSISRIQSKKKMYKGKTHPTLVGVVGRSKTSPPPPPTYLGQVSISTPPLPRTFPLRRLRHLRFLILHPLPRRRTHLPTTSLPPSPHNLQPRERRRVTRRMHRLATRRSRRPSAVSMRSRMARWCFVFASDNALPTPTHGFADASLTCFGKSGRGLCVVVVRFYTCETRCCVAGWRTRGCAWTGWCAGVRLEGGEGSGTACEGRWFRTA